MEIFKGNLGTEAQELGLTQEQYLEVLGVKTLEEAFELTDSEIDGLVDAWEEAEANKNQLAENKIKVLTKNGEMLYLAKEFFENTFIPEGQINHIYNDHMKPAEERLGQGKSQFNLDEVPERLIAEVLENINSANVNRHVTKSGNVFILEKDFGRNIGASMNGNRNMAIIRIAINEDGSIRSAYPRDKYDGTDESNFTIIN